MVTSVPSFALVAPMLIGLCQYTRAFALAEPETLTVNPAAVSVAHREIGRRGRERSRQTQRIIDGRNRQRLETESRHHKGERHNRKFRHGTPPSTRRTIARPAEAQALASASRSGAAPPAAGVIAQVYTALLAGVTPRRDRQPMSLFTPPGDFHFLSANSIHGPAGARRPRGPTSPPTARARLCTTRISPEGRAGSRTAPRRHTRSRSARSSRSTPPKAMDRGGTRIYTPEGLAVLSLPGKRPAKHVYRICNG